MKGLDLRLRPDREAGPAPLEEQKVCGGRKFFVCLNALRIRRIRGFRPSGGKNFRKFPAEKFGGLE